MKLNQLQNAKRAFEVRSQVRSSARRELRELFQNGEVSVKLFRHRTKLLSAEQRADEKATGFAFDSAAFA